MPTRRSLALHGEEGIDMLQRLQKGFNFGDGEDAIMEFSIEELRAGHYVLGVEVEDREAALRVIDLTTPLVRTASATSERG